MTAELATLFVLAGVWLLVWGLAGGLLRLSWSGLEARTRDWHPADRAALLLALALSPIALPTMVVLLGVAPGLAVSSPPIRDARSRLPPVSRARIIGRSSPGSTSISPAVSTALPDLAMMLALRARSIPAMPMADNRPPMVVGMRQTKSEISAAMVMAVLL